MQKVCAKMVPKNLTIEQKDIRKNKRVDHLDRIANEQESFSSVITGDELWIFEYDPKTKRLRSCCCLVLPEGKEKKLPESETGCTFRRTPVVDRSLDHQTKDSTI
ncbi:HTH_48 domain-containing protein [Trichonephila clavipes]|nr:HTH_48 domain-containing protein [Trichonephila clavipes]